MLKEYSLTQYQQDATRTESRIGSINTSGVCIHTVLTSIVHAAEIADQLKKHIFYGKEIDHAQVVRDAENAAKALIEISLMFRDLGGRKFIDSDSGGGVVKPTYTTQRIDPRILHVALGAITESAELAKALMPAMKYGDTTQVDLANFAEEVGDLNWYVNGIFPDAVGIPATKTLETNIEKLKARFPDKFTQEKAITRDLNTERAILEKGIE